MSGGGGGRGREGGREGGRERERESRDGDRSRRERKGEPVIPTATQSLSNKFVTENKIDQKRNT